MVLLFFDTIQNFGEASDSLGWEIGKAAITAVFSALLLYLGLQMERRSEKVEENEDKILTLYLFNEHAKSIVRSSLKTKPIFTLYYKRIEKNPFDDIVLAKTLVNPDIQHVEKVDPKTVYEAFLLIYPKDKKQATKDYRDCKNAVSFLNTIISTLYDNYEKINREIYNKKQEYREGLATLRSLINDALLNFTKTIPHYKKHPQFLDLNENILAYLHLLDEPKKLEFHHQMFITPLKTMLLEKYQHDLFATPLLKQIKYMENLRSVIIGDTKDLAFMIKNNMLNLDFSTKQLNLITIDLDNQLSKQKIIKQPQ